MGWPVDPPGAQRVPPPAGPIPVMRLSLDSGKADRLSCPVLRRRVIAAKEWHNSPFEKWNQKHPCGKTANMRKIGYAPTITGKCIRHSDELAANPDAENDPCGKVDESDKNDDQYKGPNRCLGMQHQIGAQNAGNAP